MSQSNRVPVTDTTATNPETYNSSSIARFVWEDMPMAEHGVLHVEFQSSDQYMYIGVPKRLAQGLKNRAHEPEKFSDSVGQFFYKNIRNRYHRKGRDYTETSHL